VNRRRLFIDFGLLLWLVVGSAIYLRQFSEIGRSTLGRLWGSR